MRKLCIIGTTILLTISLLGCSTVKKENANSDTEKKVEVKTVSENTNKNQEQNKQTQKPENPQKPEQPKVASKKVIVIDPGHGNRSNLEKEPISPESKEMKIKDGGGADGVNTKTPEYEINMKVSMKLKEILEQKGYVVKMTKTENSQSPGNVERAEIGNKENAALVIRIHADSSESTTAVGASILVPAPINNNTSKIYNQSKNYGTTILNTLISEVGMRNKGVVERKDMTGFNWSKVPVVLVEMGFLSNPQEEKLLCSQNYQDKIANALSHGIENVFK